MGMRKIYFNFAIIFAIILPPVLAVLAHDNDQQLAFADQTTTAKMVYNQFNKIHTSGSSSNSTIPKLAVLNFYDDEKDQLINAKAILDKYGFKGTFFIVCSWAGSNTDRMTWQDISQLYREGHDIESHTWQIKL
jgi:hypothetical protein